MKNLLQIYQSIFLLMALVVCTIPSCNSIKAQSLQADTLTTHFDLLGVKDGLFAGFITNTVIDKKGFLWIGTNYGLQRYDGNKIVNFKHHEGDKFSSPNTGFKFLLDDKNGRLWLSNYKKNHFIFEKSTERFISLPFEIDHLLFTDDANNLWFVNKSNQLCTLPLNKIPDDLLLLSTSWQEANVKCLSITDQQIDLKTSKIYLQADRSIWVITNSMLLKFSSDLERSELRLEFERSLEKKLHNNVVYQPNLFIDSTTNTIYLFNYNSICEIDQITGNSNLCYDLPNGYFSPIPWLAAPNGDIWLRVSGIIATVNLKQQKLTEFRIPNKTSTSKGTISGRRLVIDHNQNVWIPTNGFGIYKYSYLRNRFKYAGENHEGPPLSLVELGGTEIIIESDKFRGFFERENRKFINFYQKPYVPSCAGNPIRSIIPTRITDKTYRLDFKCWQEKRCYTAVIDENGNLLSPIKESKCTFDQNPFSPIEGHPGWFRSARLIESKKLISLQLKYAPSPGPNQKVIEPIYYKRELDVSLFRSPHLFTKNDFWFGYRDGGIIRFNLTTQKWQDYKTDKENSNSLSSDIIYYLTKDPYYPDSLLWIGTGNGINVLNISTDEITVINEKDGLPNNVINMIQADNRNNFWISTNNGMAYMDYPSRKIHSFSQSDGLQHSEFNVGVGTKTPDGLLYFGGMGGLTFFDPEDFYADSLASNTEITSFKTYNNPVLFKRSTDTTETSHLFTKPISEAQTIKIPYGVKMFSFEFSTLDLTDPSKNEYRYKLSGFDKNWIYLGTKNEATFTNLAPGKYNLNVQGRSYIGKWSEVNNKIKIIILTPWWLSYWFRALVVLVVLAAIWALYKYRQKQEKNIQGLRNRISKDLHDEIGSTLSSISLYTTVVQHKIKEPENEIKSILQKINESSTSVMESINDIVWTISSSNETIRDIINRLRSFTSDLIQLNRSVEYEVEPKLLDRSVNMIVKRNIYMIMKEAINNANKYSQATHIKVTIKEIANQMELCIIDNGIGFDVSKSESKSSLGGNGLRNMESRVEEIGGKLSIESSEGKGTKIQVLFNLKSKS